MQGRPIERVQFRGNRKVEDDAIRVQLLSKPGTLFDAAKLREDIRAMWKMGFFADVNVEAEVNVSGGLSLTFAVKEKPSIRKAKKAISNFRLRIGMPIGLKVTLRGERMWHFLEKLVTVALPRIRDFQGVPDKSFDGRGNYSLGLKEQLVFPEIEYDKIDRLRGMEITICTTARTDEEARALLRNLGKPFRTAS